MQQLPHHYRVRAAGPAAGELSVTSDALPDLAVAAPAEFDGPGDRWSPETLLVATVGSCLILTFRSIAQASRFAWTSMECNVEGVLDKADDGRRFTELTIRARLVVPDEDGKARGARLVEKAENLCLITKSLKAETRLEVRIDVEEPTAS